MTSLRIKLVGTAAVLMAVWLSAPLSDRANLEPNAYAIPSTVKACLVFTRDAQEIGRVPIPHGSKNASLELQRGGPEGLRFGPGEWRVEGRAAGVPIEVPEGTNGLLFDRVRNEDPSCDPAARQREDDETGQGEVLRWINADGEFIGEPVSIPPEAHGVKLKFRRNDLIFIDGQWTNSFRRFESFPAPPGAKGLRLIED